MKERLISLDFFRGLTILLMIVVNTPGSWSHVYPPLLHAEWHGITPTDLVFPFFLFIVGVSIVLAYKTKIDSGTVEFKIYQKIFKRAAIIFSLGLFLALFPKFDFSNLRVAGVLQRIAIVFLVCSILYLHTSWKTQVKICAIGLIAYCMAMSFVPFPGGSAGILEPGNNFAAFIDSYLLPGRMYQKTWDPEGVFSTIPAIGTGLTGMLIGHLITSNNDRHKKIIWIFAWGFILFVLGNVWSWFFPLNKNLWTSSYVLFTSGLATMFLGCSMWIIDELQIQRGTKLGIVFGANAITAYVLHGIIWRLFQIPISGDAGIQRLWMDGLSSVGFDPRFVSLLWALAYMMLVYLIVLVMYKKKVFLKI